MAERLDYSHIDAAILEKIGESSNGCTGWWIAGDSVKIAKMCRGMDRREISRMVSARLQALKRAGKVECGFAKAWKLTEVRHG